MDLNAQRQPLDAPGIPEIDGELTSLVGRDGLVQVEVIEHLRVRVPAAARQAWYEAEQASWEPWLRSQVGFLGRELRWDQEREEGQLLIRWASRAEWHAIPRDEIEQVQERFERFAHAALERLGVLPPLLDASVSPGPLHGVDAPAGLHPTAPAAPVDAAPGSGGAAAVDAGTPSQRPPNPFPLVYSGEVDPHAVP